MRFVIKSELWHAYKRCLFAEIEKAKHIVYGKGKGEYVVKVPDSEIVIKKAVKDYEIYVRQIRDELYRAFMEKCGDHNMSENLAKQVLEENGLPDVR